MEDNYNSSLSFDVKMGNMTMEDCDLLQYNGTYNETIHGILCLEHAPTLTHSGMIRVWVLSGMALLSLFGNAATIFSIRRSRSRRLARHSWSAVYTLILHLSIADLLVTIFCIAGEAAWSYTVQWYAGNLACKIYKFVQVFSLYLSTFVLVLIGVDRFLAVRYPMQSLSTMRRCQRLLIAAWLLSFILSTPQLAIFHVSKGPFWEDFHQCVTHGFYSEQWQEQLYTSLSLVTMFILPLLVLVCTYVSTIITIAKSEQVFRAEVQLRCQRSAPDLNRRRLIHRAKMKSLRISVVIVMAFIICWTPYYTMMIIFMFMDPGKPESDDLQEAIFFFGSSNSLVNPLIYGAFHLWPSRKRKRNTSSRYSNRDNSLNRRSTVTNATIMRVNTGTVRVKVASPEEETLVLVENSPYSGNNNHHVRNMKKYQVVQVHQNHVNHNPGLNSTRTLASKVLLRCSEVLSNNTTKL